MPRFKNNRTNETENLPTTDQAFPFYGVDNGAVSLRDGKSCPGKRKLITSSSRSPTSAWICRNHFWR